MNDLVTIFDTASSSLNIGDQIIMEAVITELQELFIDKEQLFTVSTHAGFNRSTRKIVSKSLRSIVGGTNLLNSRRRIFRGNQWSLSLGDILEINNTVLMGVGWQNYQTKINKRAKFTYKKILDVNAIHSVRDQYTKKKLESIGLKNVVNTGCPTIWRLSPNFCLTIPSRKSSNVITTITDYRADKNNDEKMLEILKNNYKKVYLWIQGSGDRKYFESLDKDITEGISLIAPNLAEYDNILLNLQDIEFVGTRLHAGIRALQNGKRAIIISVDNRATEMGKDFCLNVLERSEITSLEQYINKDIQTKIKLPDKEIKLWKEQFMGTKHG